MSLKPSRWASVVEAAYCRVYDACLPLDGSNYFGLSFQGSSEPWNYRMRGEAEDDLYILARGVGEFKPVHPNYQKAVVADAVYNTYLDSNCSLEALQKAALTSVRKWQSKPKERFQTWIHLDVAELPAELTAIKVNGRRLQAVTGADFFWRLTEEGLDTLKRRSTSDDIERCRHFIKGEYRATDSNIALDQAIDDFSIVRAVLNWHPKLRTRSWSYGNTQEACDHYPPLVYGISKEAGKAEAYPAYGTVLSAERPINPKFASEITQMLSLFAPKFKDNSVRLLLAEAMSLASAGLDSIYPFQQFLSCWTALEKIALVDRGSPSEVAKHISRLWVDAPGSKTEFLLETLASDRNDLVHEGKFDSEDHTKLILLREITATAFWRLGAMVKDLPTTTALRAYYSSARLTKDELRDKVRGVSYAQKIKEECEGQAKGEFRSGE